MTSCVQRSVLSHLYFLMDQMFLFVINYKKAPATTLVEESGKQNIKVPKPSEYLCRVSCLTLTLPPINPPVCSCVFLCVCVKRWQKTAGMSSCPPLLSRSGRWHVPSTVVFSTSGTHQRSSGRRAWWSKWRPVDGKEKTRVTRVMARLLHHTLDESEISLSLTHEASNITWALQLFV